MLLTPASVVTVPRASISIASTSETCGTANNAGNTFQLHPHPPLSMFAAFWLYLGTALIKRDAIGYCQFSTRAFDAFIKLSCKHVIRQCGVKWRLCLLSAGAWVYLFFFFQQLLATAFSFISETALDTVRRIIALCNGIPVMVAITAIDYVGGIVCVYK